MHFALSFLLLPFTIFSIFAAVRKKVYYERIK